MSGSIAKTNIKNLFARFYRCTEVNQILLLLCKNIPYHDVKICPNTDEKIHIFVLKVKASKIRKIVRQIRLV